jgi:phenylacetate-CoA ligase
MYSLRRKIYESLPDVVKVPVAWIPLGWIAGSAYRRTLARGSRFERAPRDEILAFQEEMLGQLLRFACDQVPAYRPLRSTVERLPAFEAIKAFPLIDKTTVQRDRERFLPRDFHRLPHYEVSTGGTSGNQLTLYLDDDSQAEETAFMHRQWARVGYTPRCRKATFRGVDFPGARHGRCWQINPIYNEMQFSPFHMNRQTLPQYWERILAWRPTYLHGYPSALSLLARWVRDERISMQSLTIRAALLASEAIFPEQRTLIEEAFNTRAFSWYGHSERLILAGECEKTPVYHHLPDYGFLEIVDNNGNVVTEEGASGELVGTTFWNRCQPLIRYRTEDRARRLDFRCSCGRCFDRFDEVEGRWKQEYVIGKHGSKISPTALNMHGPMFDKVTRYQYYQKQVGILELRVMLLPGFTSKDLEQLQDAYRHKVGDELDVFVKPVDDIPLTPRGKLKRLIQELPVERVPGAMT